MVMTLAGCSEKTETATPPASAAAVTASAFTPQTEGDLLLGLHRAVAYSGFREGQHPDRGDGAVIPSKEEILEDLEILTEHGFFLIRLYDSQENSRDVLEVIRDHGLPTKVMLGAWLKAEKSNHETCAWLTEPIPAAELAANRLANEAELLTTIGLVEEFPDIVAAVNVGNETLVDWNDHGVPIDRMVGYLRQMRAAIDLPVTTAENYAAWIQFADQLNGEVDFVGVHTYPIWENFPVDGAMAVSIQNMVDVQNAFPGHPLAIVEAGWPSTASDLGDLASEATQLRHFNDLSAWCRDHNVTCFWFEAFDEPWKGNPDNPTGAEKHWGLWFVDRTPKPVVGELK